MFRRERKRGQSTLEYVIIITAIVGAIIMGALTLGSHDTDKGLAKLLKKAGDTVNSGAAKIGKIAE